jgi:hypothetical protein
MVPNWPDFVVKKKFIKHWPDFYDKLYWVANNIPYTTLNIYTLLNVFTKHK